MSKPKTTAQSNLKTTDIRNQSLVFSQLERVNFD